VTLALLVLAVLGLIGLSTVLYRKTPTEQAQDDHEQMMTLAARRKGRP
jgi:hypothetical protein